MSKFWITQPVNKGEYPECVTGKIKKLDSNAIKMFENHLPENLIWTSLNVNDDNTLNIIYEFLKENYVANEMYGLEYSKEFLKWSLTPPGYSSELHLGLLYKTSSGVFLVGFITGVKLNVCINGKVNDMIGINYLSVHKELRNKNLAPLLIKEISRRSVLLNMEVALYTVGKKITKPFSKSYYKHIFLNIQKLKECEFISDDQTSKQVVHIKSFYHTRRMNVDDTDDVYTLLNKFMSKYKVHQVFSKKEILHLFVNDIMYTNVIVDNKSKKIIGMYSIYSIKSRLLFKNKHSHIDFSYLYYYCYDKNYITVNDIIKESRLLAVETGHDILNITNTMDYPSINNERLIDYHTDTKLYYYLYNYVCNDINPEELGVLLV